MTELVRVQRGRRSLEPARRDVRGSLRQIEGNAELGAVEIQAISYVTNQAMQSVAMISQMEGQLAGLVPLATTRLKAIADMSALATAEVVADAYRRTVR